MQCDGQRFLDGCGDTAAVGKRPAKPVALARAELRNHFNFNPSGFAFAQAKAIAAQCEFDRVAERAQPENSISTPGVRPISKSRAVISSAPLIRTTRPARRSPIDRV